MARRFAIGVLVLPALLLLTAPFIGYALGAGDIGFTSDGDTIVVEPGGPAAKAGMQTGDRPVLSPALSFRLDWYFVGTAVGKPYSFAVRRHGRTLHFRVVGIRDEHHGWPSARDIITLIVGLSFVGVATFLILRVTTRVTWAIFILSVTEASAWATNFGGFAAYVSPYFVLFVLVWWTAGIASWPWAAATIAVRFPNEAPSQWGRLYERCTVGLGIALAIWSSREYIAKLYTGSWLSSNLTFEILTLGPVLVGAVVFLVRGARSRPETRKRLQWVIVGFAVYVASSTASILLRQLIYSEVIRLGELALPASIAYAVLRHRVLDTRIVLGRAVVYSAVTSILVLLFIGIEIISEKWLAGTGLATGVQFIAAVAGGFTIRLLHRRIEETANWLFFRERLAGRERLEEAATSLQHAESRAAIGEFLVAEPVNALKLASAALFVRSEATFTRLGSIGWRDTDLQEITTDDPLLARMQARWDTIDLTDVGWHRDDVPHGLAAPLLVAPVKSHGQIIAMSFYGGRTAGDALDTSEVLVLRTLAGAAAAAFDHLEASELRLQNGLLRQEAAELRRENARLLDAIHRPAKGIPPAMKKPG